MKKKKPSGNILVKEYIAQALAKLIQTKSLSEISITELAQIAGVSRMTYYRNFNSKEEIFSSYFDILFARYDEEEGSDPKGVYHDAEHMVHYFSSFILKNKDFLYSVVSNGYGNLFLSTMTDYIVKKWQQDKNNHIEYYTLCAFAGSLYNLYVSWVKNNYRETPEEMAQILINIHGDSLSKLQKYERNAKYVNSIPNNPKYP